MGGKFEDEWVYCVKCPEKGRTAEKRSKCPKQEIEQSQWKIWTCSKCREETIGLELTDFIKTRISVTKTEDEDRSKFIFRELLQNADDVKSTILVLRFEKDALYVANNGRAFTTTSTLSRLSDFDRISRVLGRHQAEDKETVGHFGSGFQTVYAITNSPEVHSSHISGQMNPTRQKWNYSIKERTSPYIHKQQKGVLFRFPWRDDIRAEDEIDGIKVFEDSNLWPRWNKEERRRLFEDLVRYLHQAILCCQYITMVRLIWHHEAEYEGYQNVRDFTLRVDDSEATEMKSFIGSIQQGFIESKAWKDEWNDSFQVEAWKWRGDFQSYKYLIGSKNATSRTWSRVYVGKKADGSVDVTTRRESLQKELKRGDLHVLFPLFDVSEAFPQADGRAFLYSVIPLPKRSRNKFAFSAHFFPTEDRKDVDVEGYGGKSREWYQSVMRNFARLYRELFPIFLDEVVALAAPNDVKQKIVFDVVPAIPLHDWMRPGREIEAKWAEMETNLTVSRVLGHPILLSDGEWIKPMDAYWTKDGNEESVIKILGHRTFTEGFVNHPHFGFLSERLHEQEVTLKKFDVLWYKFEHDNQTETGVLVYNQELTTGNVLNKAAVNELIEYCITKSEAWKGTIDKPVIPGKDGVLRRLRDYPLLPESLDFLYDILPKALIIHKDFQSVALQEKGKEVGRVTCDGVVKLIDRTVSEHPTRYENMDENHHRVISRVLRVLIEDMDFALKDGMKELRFVPYKMGNKISVGTPNVRFVNGNMELIRGSHTGENYQRDSIFGVQRLEVRGLTKEVKERIKFLSLLDSDDNVVSKVEEKLSLEKLMEVRKTPTNFIRHFLSPRHESLFVDSHLKEFLGVSDKETILKQKKEFQKALKIYFDCKHTETYLTPENMSKVPCLYDGKDHWYNAGEFALDIYPELELIGYKSLHNELQQWPRETLLALGVAESPSSSKIINAIIALAQEKERHREELTNILVWLLTSDVPIEFGKTKLLKWLPTVDGGFGAPEQVLSPSPENKEIVGEDFEGLLDYSSCNIEIAERALGRTKGKLSETRLGAFGIIPEPRLSDMLDVAENRRKANKAPPPKLFDALSKKLASEETSPAEEGGNYGYYLDNQWVDSNRIRIMDKNTVPEGLRDVVVVLSETKHSEYLLFDGAQRNLSPDDILRPLHEKKITPTLNLWDGLRSLKHLLNETHENTYGESQIYPVSDNLVSPKNIIFMDSDGNGTSLEEGAIGEYYVIGYDLTERHGEVLKKLGARSHPELDENDFVQLLESERTGSKVLDASKVNLVLRLIKRIGELNPTSPFPDRKLWPAKHNDEIVWMRPRFCYLKDSPIAKHFEGDLPFLCVEIDGEEDKALKEYACLSKCKRFSDHVTQISSPRAAYPRVDRDMTLILKEMGTALSVKFKGIAETSSCFEWLKNIEVKTCDELVIDYTVGSVRKTVERFALIEEEDSRNIIYIQLGNIRMYDQLVDWISKGCAERGFPEKGAESEELRFLIYKLLTHRPYHWGDLIEGYEYSYADSFYLVILGEEGGKGYLETRETLQGWYGCCQICNNKTPRDEEGIETMEQVKSVVSMRGGRYQGIRESYSPSNCLLLCPRHQVLYERRLVKFQDFEDKKNMNETINAIKRKIEECNQIKQKEPERFIDWTCEVFEGKLGEHKASPKGGIRSSWTENEITFTVEHLIGFLENMLSYLEESET